MPNPLGNPDFKPKYDEKTKVIRLPESIANTLASLLAQGCASSDILEGLRPLSQERIALYLTEADSTRIHIPVELRFLRAIKNAAQQEKTHYLQWILNQCKKGLNLSSSYCVDEARIIQLIDQRFEMYERSLEARYKSPVFSSEIDYDF